MLFLGRQNIPLRGHRDDSLIDLENVKHDNEGNFRELPKFRGQAEDQALGNYKNNAPKNATYLSKTIQNEIINLI